MVSRPSLWLDKFWTYFSFASIYFKTDDLLLKHALSYAFQMCNAGIFAMVFSTRCSQSTTFVQLCLSFAASLAQTLVISVAICRISSRVEFKLVDTDITCW